MITTYYPPYNLGGDGIFVHCLANELAQRGHQVDVIHCLDAYGLAARRKPPTSYRDHPNVIVHGLNSPFGFLSPLATQQTGFPFFKSNAIEEILRTGFDVIHYHNVSLVGGPRVLQYGNAIKLYTTHECWLICPTHVMFKFKRAPCTRKSCFLCSLVYKRPPQWWRYFGLLEAAAKHVDTFLAPSRFVQDLHCQMGFKGSFVHLPNFVPEATLAPPPSPNSKPYFLFVGRLEKLKGLQTILPLFKRYDKALLRVAGTGDYEPQLRRLAGRCDNIQFLGRVDDFERLQELYRGTVALIVPSIGYEVFPLVLLEAFRQQRPVIARNLGGIPEIIEESGGGFVYDTEEELVAAMDQLVDDRSHGQRLGLRGFSAYQKNWTAEAHIGRYLGLIQKIASCRHQPEATMREEKVL
jgi:glycosyltransferase involved in cell wall biosynthesis